MRHTLKVIALIVALTLVLSLGGCKSLRKQATDPVPTLPPEEDETGAMIEQATDAETEATEEADSTAEESEPLQPTATPEEQADEESSETALSATPTPVPTIAASPTPVPVTVEDPTPEPTVLPIPESGTYTVKAGDNLYQIALQYNMGWQSLAAHNGITNPSALQVGQVLQIPADGTSTPSTSPGTGGTTYVVKPGDWLWQIAREHGVNPIDLALYNDLPYPYNVYPDQVLYIP